MDFRVKICGTAQPALNSKDVCPPLSDRLAKLGYGFEDDPRKADLLINFNHDRLVYDSFQDFKGKRGRTVLVRLEPAAVFPSQYNSSVENLYGHILTPGSFTVTPALPWPYYYNQNPLHPDMNSPALEMVVLEALRENIYEFEPWNQRPIKLSLIASNKVSPTSKNNYKLRRKMAYSLPKDVLRVYGGLWNSELPARIRHRAGVFNFAMHSHTFPNLIEVYGNLFREYSSVVGIVDDKQKVIRESKFSLVIENDNNYVSEKLIDALIGGSIPIYFGGPYETLGIPSDLVITNLNSNTEIIEYIENISNQEIQEFQNRLKSWLSSPSFYLHWDGDRVFANIADEIDQHFRKVVP